MSDVLSHDELIGRLVRVRRFRGMTADDLARVSGMSRSVIANVESGRRPYVAYHELLAWSDALQVSLAAVVGSKPLPIEGVA